MAQAAAFILMYLVFPVWVAAGLADWWCHRRSGIERTSGLRESLWHWLLFAEIGAAMLAVAFLEIDAAVLAWVFAVFVVHELTVYFELRWVMPQREITAFESMVHSFMEVLPLASLALLAVSAWDRLADWSVRLKDEPMPVAYLLGAGAAVLLFNAVPLIEETLRCWKRRGALRSDPALRDSTM